MPIVKGYVIQPGVNLQCANLTGADLTGACLTGACLKQALLMSTDFWLADLVDVNLTGANLDGADLRSCDLRGADLRGASLVGTLMPYKDDMEGAHLTTHQCMLLVLTGQITAAASSQLILHEDQPLANTPLCD